LNRINNETSKDTLKSYFPALWWFLVVAKSHKKYQSICNWFLIQQAPSKHRKALSKVRAKNKVKVFFLTHESVWNTTYSITYYLYILGLNLHFCLSSCEFWSRIHVVRNGENLSVILQKGTVTKTYNEKEYLDIKKVFSQTWFFYTNPYEGVQDYRYYIKAVFYTLTGYVPYAIMTTKYELFYNTDFHNLVWKIFSETLSINK
jgi:hypothetical protein